ncbi:Sec-independent protein translocase protein TatB [Brucella pseudogrignonensis]|uniref:Sec-independent protein translocase protein TatB n=1 Tax=Brucella pseudogrignonensis TaxID=419475 RepID=UPI000CFE33AE|nr:Sec-independent protein translocase protein TatB [Brucella pseudogrignonensis]MQP38547.1 twin-arginine translocase subunit TatB [Ochrobactrum sp. MYb237]PQZ43178.1 twin-arginine translocase subunit TatB [Brucella pseudogrignonensis]PRA42925.1 twin-arginine translocase subunit TatB [Brucella pseudogrignonensis]PRA72608.1 twin-arginine translocase subunit TatB [Brucella pseudogrignonensis]
MFDIGWSELLIIAIVMIVVVGPKDLPKMLRAFGKATARMRSTANEFRHQFNEALKEAELEDVKNIVDEARKLDPRSKLTQVFDPIRSAGEDIRSGLQSTTSMSPAEPAKVAEVTTPVEANGTTVPLEAPAEKPAPKAQAAKPKAPRKKAAPAVEAEVPAASKPVKAKAVAAKPRAAAKVEPVAKAVAPKKTASAKPATPKAAVPAAKKTTKKTTEKTGTKA